ncbi:unnamed protein product [Ranitomeya imitator]|uniref:Uncharacterized protein n=1 Tax=Ranitomeya imitator TaxID=111125 RepID=A0ABN9LBA8_9NEOB|nr:unnamed protein product [Ranitomeya imitator]
MEEKRHRSEDSSRLFPAKLTLQLSCGKSTAGEATVKKDGHRRHEREKRTRGEHNVSCRDLRVDIKIHGKSKNQRKMTRRKVTTKHHTLNLSKHHLKSTTRKAGRPRIEILPGQRDDTNNGESSTEKRSSVKMIIVHLDLKGAPPKVSYLLRFCHFSLPLEPPGC